MYCSLLKGALKKAYLNNEDLFDSSNYDNCDGVPRYERAGKGGLVWSRVESDAYVNEQGLLSGGKT
jgi:hypothetical protein